MEAIFAGAVFLKRKDSGIQSLSDLSGKKIAVPQMGNTQHLCLLSILSDQGLKTVDAGGNVTINASSNADIVLNREAIMKFAEISKKEGFISEVPEENDVFTTEFN